MTKLRSRRQAPTESVESYFYEMLDLCRPLEVEQNSTMTESRPICHVCHKQGHIARFCRQNNHPPQNQRKTESWSKNHSYQRPTYHQKDRCNHPMPLSSIANSGTQGEDVQFAKTISRMFCRKLKRFGAQQISNTSDQHWNRGPNNLIRPLSSKESCYKPR